MYMGVILVERLAVLIGLGAPHVYGGDPQLDPIFPLAVLCSPCIWG